MILEPKIQKFDSYTVDSYIKTTKLLSIIENTEFFNDLIRLFQPENVNVLEVGNSKYLLEALNKLDMQCEKYDLHSDLNSISLKKLLENEIAIFDIFNVKDETIIKMIGSNTLTVETRYSSKNDILDYYHFSKFANFCRDNNYIDLIETIKSYLETKNANNNVPINLRLIFKKDNRKFYLRAITSSDGYKNFGINFSIFVILISLQKFALSTKTEVFIEHYKVDDSTLYISFGFQNDRNVSKKLSLEFNLILENDEIKRNAVSINGIFKLRFKDGERESKIYLKPNFARKEEYSVDLLTYSHRGSVDNVFEKVEKLPLLIETFITQVIEDAKRIDSIQNPENIKNLLFHKIKFAKKSEILKYKPEIQKRLAKISVDSLFSLFEGLSDIDKIFEEEDIVSINYWREKLYEAIFNGN